MVKAKATSPVTKSPSHLGNGSTVGKTPTRTKEIKKTCLTYVQERKGPKLPQQIRDLFREGGLYLTASVNKDSGDEETINLTVRSSRSYHPILVEYVGWVIGNFVTEKFPGTNVDNDIRVRVEKEAVISNADLGADEPGNERSYGDRLAAAARMFGMQ